jgi:hypothetical protein
MDFEEWYREAKKTNNCGFTAKDFFEAGQQSKQVEIDALKAKINNVVRVVYNETDDYYIDEKIQEILHDA